VGSADLIYFLSYFDTTNVSIPRTVLFKYNDDANDSNTSSAGLNSLSSTSTADGNNFYDYSNQIIGVITDTDHRTISAIGTNEKSIDVTIDNSAGDTEDFVVFSDQTGNAAPYGDVTVSALGSGVGNGHIVVNFGVDDGTNDRRWSFLNLGSGSYSWQLKMNVGRKVGSNWTFSGAQPVTKLFVNETATTQSVGGAGSVVLIPVGGPSTNKIDINEHILPAVQHSGQPQGIDVQEFFLHYTGGDLVVANTTDVAIQMSYSFEGVISSGLPVIPPSGDTTFEFQGV